jgi:hypothetical protein
LRQELKYAMRLWPAVDQISDREEPVYVAIKSDGLHCIDDY